MPKEFEDEDEDENECDPCSVFLKIRNPQSSISNVNILDTLGHSTYSSRKNYRIETETMTNG